MLYFDTSALMPYYRPEPLSAEIQALLIQAQEQVVISRLVEVEFASVLARLVRMGDLDARSAGVIQTAFSQDIARNCYRVLELASVHFKQARDWLLERKAPLRTLDALHLAVAQISDTRLVTSDVGLASAAEKYGVAVEFFTGHAAARI
ncbi:MAG: type II toxin-antitoxin system VapC family toxin [Pseudomonadota bacterium]|nr:type II toxin-antitoxin system VapC family toxin [Gammaproteobacteria bacterium]MDQ3584055.1 type II toxin-antitoxin system VapC family toxin [Pseudomonadota bacterium]